MQTKGNLKHLLQEWRLHYFCCLVLHLLNLKGKFINFEIETPKELLSSNWYLQLGIIGLTAIVLRIGVERHLFREYLFELWQRNFKGRR